MSLAQSPFVVRKMSKTAQHHNLLTTDYPNDGKFSEIISKESSKESVSVLEEETVAWGLQSN